MDEYELTLSFDRDDQEFTLGVEVGIVYQRLLTEPLPITVLMHAANAEMALRLAEHRDVAVRSVEAGDDWLEVTFEAVAAHPKAVKQRKGDE